MECSDKPIERAKEIIRGSGSNVDEILCLNKKLKAERAFNYARKLLFIARSMPVTGEDENEKIKKRILREQQYALCTYKDQDLPLIKRLDDALIILNGDILTLDSSKDSETLGIAGAVYKRKWEAGGQKKNLEQSLFYYSKGYELHNHDYGYTGINAAYVCDLLAWIELKEATSKTSVSDYVASKHKYAKEIRQDLASTLPAMSANENWLEKEWWYLVTIAEANFGLNQYDVALTWIQKAMKLEGNPEWQLESSARQLVQLATIQEHKDDIDFSGFTCQESIDGTNGWQ